MKSSSVRWTEGREFQALLALMVVGLPAFLINLGGLPLIGDEGIRSLVALEMDMQQQFIAPTLYGELYFKKPPLWNWILLGSFKLFGYTPLAARLPTIFFLYCFTVHIYFVFTRHTTRRQGMLTAALFLTCGRILFWDSMLALIDITFSWVIFAMWVWIYEQHEKKLWLKLYLGAYLLVSIAFMLKALPALVFIGFTLLAYQIYRGTFFQLLKWQHFAGLGLLVAIIGSYFLLYNKHLPLDQLLTVYLDESTQRTVIEYGFWESFRQLFVFPCEMLYHYLPWSLGLFFLTSSLVRREIRSHSWLMFCALTFLANIWVYWTSPEVYARYLIMFGPLYFGMMMGAYHRLSWQRRGFEVLLIVMAILTALGSFIPPFYHESAGLPKVWLISTCMFSALAIASWCLIRYREERLIIFCFILLTLRIGFDLVILPLRSTTTSQAQVQRDSIYVGQKYAGEPMYVYRDYEINHDNGFYLTRERGQLLDRSHFLVPGSYMLMCGADYPWLLDEYQVVDSIRIKEVEQYFHVIKVPNEY